MARPREFDMEEATARAMALFWSGGYEDVSLSDLLDGMGIARGSLYKAYGDKHSVWLAALALYEQTVVQPTAEMLEDASNGAGLQRVAAFLKAPAAAIRENDDRRGCFLCNAAVDRAATNGDAQVQVQAMFLRLEQALYTALHEEGQHQGWSPPDIQVKARTTLAVYIGLRVMARSRTPIEALEAISADHLATLSQGRL